MLICREASPAIGMLSVCPQDKLEALAALAKHSDAYGDPSTWDYSVHREMGIVIGE